MIRFVLLCLLVLVPSLQAVSGEEAITRWTGQTVYVPLYSHIYADERYRDRPFLLTATLSVRNTDPEHPMLLRRADYYDSAGQLLQPYLSQPVAIPPLASTRYIVRESENRGGSGAKFLVEWEADTGITEPIIESIMIGTQMQQGISFVSRGRVIRGSHADK
jgi:hypothetical protein